MTRPNAFGLHVNPFAGPRRSPVSLQSAMETAAKGLRSAEHACVLTGPGLRAQNAGSAALGQSLSALFAYIPHLTHISQNVDDLLESSRAATLACDVFLSIEASTDAEPVGSLPWIAASHGATVIVVNRTMRGQREGPSIVQLEGFAGSLLPRLVSMAFAGRKPRYSDE